MPFSSATTLKLDSSRGALEYSWVRPRNSMALKSSGALVLTVRCSSDVLISSPPADSWTSGWKLQSI